MISFDDQLAKIKGQYATADASFKQYTQGPSSLSTFPSLFPANIPSLCVYKGNNIYKLPCNIHNVDGSRESFSLTMNKMQQVRKGFGTFEEEDLWRSSSGGILYKSSSTALSLFFLAWGAVMSQTLHCFFASFT